MKSAVLGVLAGLLTVVLIVAVLGATYLVIAGLSWLVCFCFGLPWNWFVPLGIMAIFMLVRMFFKYVTYSKE